MPIGTPGSLTALMNALVALEQTVHADLRVYRWKPTSVELPAIYNWLDDSPFDAAAVDQFVEPVRLLARVAVRHTDADEEMARLEIYADAFRDVIDRGLHRRPPLNGAADKAQRDRMRMVTERVGETPVLCIEFPLRCDMWREITPNS